MSHNSDSSEKQQQLSRSKKRSRWNDEEPDAGEILESDDTIYNQGHFDHSSQTIGTKRLRPAQESSNQHSGNGVVETTKISRRDELERERQIRMAALRAETEDDGHANDHDVPTVSQPPPDSTTAFTKKKQSHRNGDDPEEEEEEDDDNAKMMQDLFGIRQFGSSKNTKVATNHTSAAIGTIAKHLKPRKYRQYMNRKNGFNRPLDNI